MHIVHIVNIKHIVHVVHVVYIVLIMHIGITLVHFGLLGFTDIQTEDISYA